MRLVTAGELAQVLGLAEDHGVETVRRWTRQRRIPHYRFPPPDGPEVRYDLDELLAGARNDPGGTVASPDSEEAR